MRKNIFLFCTCVVMIVASLCSCAPDLEPKAKRFMPEYAEPAVEDAEIVCKHELVHAEFWQKDYHRVYCYDAEHIGCNWDVVEKHDYVPERVLGTVFEGLYNGRYYHCIIVRCSVCHGVQMSTTDFILCSKDGKGCTGDCENAQAFAASLEKQKEE